MTVIARHANSRVAGMLAMRDAVRCSGQIWTGDDFMHVLIAGLYACIIWLALLAYVVIVNGPVLRFLVLSPLLISGAIAAIITLDLALCGIGWVWRRWRRLSVN